MRKPSFLLSLSLILILILAPFIIPINGDVIPSQIIYTHDGYANSHVIDMIDTWYFESNQTYNERISPYNDTFVSPNVNISKLVILNFTVFFDLFFEEEITVQFEDPLFFPLSVNTTDYDIRYVRPSPEVWMWIIQNGLGWYGGPRFMNIRNDTTLNTLLLVMIDDNRQETIEMSVGAQCYMWNVNCFTASVEIDPVLNEAKLFSKYQFRSVGQIDDYTLNPILFFSTILLIIISHKYYQRKFQ